MQRIRNMLDSAAGLAGYVPAQEYAEVARSYLSSTGQVMQQMIGRGAPVAADKTVAMNLVHANQIKLAHYQDEFSSLYQVPERWNSENAIKFLRLILGCIDECIEATSAAHGTIPANCDDIGSVSNVLVKHQEALTLYKEMWQESLDERLIFLKKMPDEQPIIAKIEKEPQSIRERYKYAYMALREPALAAKLSSEVLHVILSLFANKGIGNSAGKALHEAVCVEVLKRIAEDNLLENHPDVGLIRQYFKAQANSTFENELEKVIEDKQKQKAQAFKKIFQALCEAQRTISPSKFLRDKMDLSAPKLLAEIEKTVALDPNCTAAIAWALTKKYFRNASENNFQLVSELLGIGNERSSGITKLLDKKPHLTRDNFEQEKKDPKSVVRLVCAKLADASNEKNPLLKPT